MLEAFFAKINRSSIVKKKKEEVVEKQREYLEDFDEEVLVWKRLIRIAWQPVWYNSLLLFGWYSSVSAFLGVCFAMNNKNSLLAGKKKGIFYLCDMCWAIDILLRTSSRYIKNLNTGIMSPPQKNWIFIGIELISIFPFELFFLDNELYYNLAALNRSLKIIHVIYIFHYINSMVNDSVLRNLIQLLYLLYYFMYLIGTCVICIKCNLKPHKCNFLDNDEGAVENTLHSLRKVAATVFNKGFGLIAYSNNISKFLVVISSFIIYIGIICVYTANISFAFCARASHKSNYRYKLKAVCKFFDKKGADEDLVKLLETFFDKMWSICDGHEGYMAETKQRYVVNEFRYLLPKSINMEIYTDVCWGLYVHSKLFSRMDIAFLREISCVIKQQVYISGQYIYHKNEMKDKMVYVFSGTVQVISPDDDESSLLNLSVGTCLGESSIVIPYKSIYSLKCLTPCVLQVLDRKDFLKVALKYPNRLNTIFNDIIGRYRDAITLYEIKLVVNKKPGKVILQSLSTMWLNFTLHKLMGYKDRDRAFTHAIQNIYLKENVSSDIFKNYVFNADYLSMLAITERVELNSDTLFIKSTFPHILKPNTGLVLFFDVTMAILSIISTMAIPTVILLGDTHDIVFYTVNYTFTTFWVLDIIIKLSTAVIVKHKILTKRFKILVYRLSEGTFLLDIFCAWPLEIFSGLIVRKYAAKIVYLNRTIKIYKVFHLLLRWERHYNSNYLLVQTLGITILLFYGTIITAAVFSFVDCLKDCSIDEKYKILFYANQIITGVGHYVSKYTMLKKYYLMNILIYSAACVFFVVSSGLIFSAYAFADFNISTVRHYTLSLIKMAKSLKLKHLIPRIQRETALQIITSDGLNIISSNYIFEIIPKPLLGYFYRNIYLDWVCLLPIFKHVPKYIVDDILQSCAVLENLESNIFIFHVGEIFTDFIILANGECERVFGDSATRREISSREALNDFDVVLGIPSRSTVNTTTDCDIIRIPYLEMRKVFIKYDPKKYNIRRMAELKYEVMKLKNESPNKVLFPYLYEDKTDSFANYSSTSKTSKSFFRKLFLPRTFVPHGKFFQCWELARCVFALISSFLYSTTSLSGLPFSHPIAIIILFLDFTAYVDLYIQAHVCFYNKNGILITDPLLTLNNYISTRFLVDLISAFPLHYILSERKYIIFNVTKVLQLYRYLGLTTYRASRNVTPISKMYMLKRIPVHIIILNLCASVFLVLNCNLDFSQNPDAIQCYETSVFLHNKMNVSTLTPLKAHLYSYYVITTTVSTIAMQGFRSRDNRTMLLLGILSTYGFYWTIFVAASIFKYYLFDYKRKYRDIKVKRLYKFMEDESIRKTLVSKVDKYLLCYSILEPFETHKYVRRFSSRIKRDVLYERFGKTLKMSCLKFGSDINHFIRNILIHTEYLIIDKNGYAQTINDVTDEIFILYSGVIEVIAPTGQVMVELYPGSLFGNLCNMTFNRMKVSIAAQGTLEVLKIKSLKFFEILQHFSSTRDEFYKLQQVHLTHIPGYSRFIYPKDKNTEGYIINDKNNNPILYLAEMIFLFFGAYLGVIGYLYQVSVNELSLYSIMFDVFCDVSFAISLILSFAKPINRKTQKWSFGNYLSKSKIFCLLVITCIPTELIIFFISASPKVKWYLFVFLKIIVLFRQYSWYSRFNQIKCRYRTDIFSTKLTFIALQACLFTLALTSFIVMIMKFLEIKQYSFAPPNYSSTSAERLLAFSVWLYMVGIALMKCSLVTYFPTNYIVVILAIAFLITMVIFSSILYAKIASVIQSAKGLKGKQTLTIRNVNTFLKNYEASLSITERVSYYINVIRLKFYGMSYPYILNEFPLYLKEAILENALGHYIYSHPVFAICHIDFKRQLFNHLRINYYHNGDYIQFKGIIDNTMYWVHFGEVVALSEASDDTDDIILKYQKSDCFGIAQGLLDKAPHYFSYRAVTYTCVLCLEKKNWSYLIPFFPASSTTIKKMGKQFFVKEQELMKEYFGKKAKET